MASELIAVVVNAALGKAKSTALDNIKLMLGFSDQLDALKAHFEAIETVLADADRRKSGSKSGRVQLWLKNVRGVAFEAEIVLDKLLYESLRRQALGYHVGEPEVCSSFLFVMESRIRDIYISMMLGSRVRRINAEFEEFNSQLSTINAEFNSIACVVGEPPATNYVVANRETDSFAPQEPKPFVVGRETEGDIIVNRLLSGSSNAFVLVLPIVGMGGLGKTTLAKSIYNHPQIESHFGKRSWTCVSSKVEGTEVLKGILESLKGGKNVGVVGRQAIVQGIQKEVGGERFLFVLDDVWNDEWFENFFESLAGLNPASGSCCVLTTRLQDDKYGFHQFLLGELSHDACWSIIISSMATRGEDVLTELDVLKEQILQKCRGLPLAAKIIGGLLRSQRKENWRSIVENKCLNDVHGSVNDKITPILKLSYDYLPSQFIKQCFVYCSVYPKDAKMDGDELIQLWMAEGYLHEDIERGRTMEEVGADHLTTLLQSSLLEKCWSWDWDRWEYQMHDLVHDLAESISREQHVGDKYPAFRHFALGKAKLKDHWNEKSMLGRMEEGEICDKMLSKCTYARVMYLYFSPDIKKIPNHVGNLIHVRSLTISGAGIESLPESLCRLYHLQTLRLEFCFNLKWLPKGLSNLISLRHLHNIGMGEIKIKMPLYMRRLTSLQTLRLFNVGEDNGRRIEELGFMNNLKGSLTIRNLELVTGKEEAASANLDRKENMIQLELIWGSTDSRSSDNWKDEQVLEGLKPCSALQRLEITDFMGDRFPRWLGELSALVSLHLYECKNITQLGYAGDTGFPSLNSLYIGRCPLLSSAPTSFPVLKRLDVFDIQVSTAVRDIISTTTNSLQFLWLCGVGGMRSLSDVIESSRSSSCLKDLDIRDCEDLSEIPSSTLECCTCLEDLKVEGCPELVSCPLNLQQTPSLSKIDFIMCPSLFTMDAILPMGFEHLTNLKHLSIGPENSEQSVDWDGLKKGCSTTLRTIAMYGSSRTQLPQQLGDFSSLAMLTISEFDSLERLPDWLAKLTSLQELELLHCPKLQHLRTDALNNLRVLRIQECPLLRTQRDEIKALPNLQLNWPDYYRL